MCLQTDPRTAEQVTTVWLKAFSGYSAGPTAQAADTNLMSFCSWKDSKHSKSTTICSVASDQQQLINAFWKHSHSVCVKCVEGEKPLIDWFTGATVAVLISIMFEVLEPGARCRNFSEVVFYCAALHISATINKHQLSYFPKTPSHDLPVLAGRQPEQKKVFIKFTETHFSCWHTNKDVDDMNVKAFRQPVFWGHRRVCKCARW